ncbi:hypothetical protein [Pseudomonas reidholzensis]|uniref:hypothetical protein n=1 Tax=Pseudomonas reidholzensis TaxID=1785162 RepID=UPI000E5B26DE|nr:hypothetical protein [Pseudomonas reidholzensis]
MTWPKGTLDVIGWKQAAVLTLAVLAAGCSSNSKKELPMQILALTRCTALINKRERSDSPAAALALDLAFDLARDLDLQRLQEAERRSCEAR